MNSAKPMASGLYSKRRLIRTLSSVVTAIALLSWISTALASGTTLWYQPSNGGTAGGTLPDFMQLLDPERKQSWSGAQRETDVLLLRANTLRMLEASRPGFIASSLAPFLARTGMRLGLDSGVATFASCHKEGSSERRAKRELEIMRRVENAGIRISFMALQSTLSKVQSRVIECPNYSVTERIRDVVWYISTVRSGLAIHDGSLKFGLIDASVAKGGTWVQKNLGVPALEIAYERLFLALANEGLRLDFVLLDHPWEAIREFSGRGRSSLTEIRDFQLWLEQQGVAPGFMLTSTKSVTEREFQERVLEVLAGLKRVHAPSSHFVLASWKRIPATELPESPADPNKYPMTRVLKDIGIFLRGRDRNPAADPPKTPQ